MDSEEILRRFAEIEEKVEKLIQTRDELEVRNMELQDKISRLEAELAEKQETENLLQEERAMVKTKIDGLLGRLDKLSTS